MAKRHVIPPAVRSYPETWPAIFQDYLDTPILGGRYTVQSFCDEFIRQSDGWGREPTHHVNRSPYMGYEAWFLYEKTWTAQDLIEHSPSARYDHLDATRGTTGDDRHPFRNKHWAYWSESTSGDGESITNHWTYKYDHCLHHLRIASLIASDTCGLKEENPPRPWIQLPFSGPTTPSAVDTKYLVKALVRGMESLDNWETAIASAITTEEYQQLLETKNVFHHFQVPVLPDMPLGREDLLEGIREMREHFRQIPLERAISMQIISLAVNATEQDAALMDQRERRLLQENVKKLGLLE